MDEEILNETNDSRVKRNRVKRNEGMWKNKMEYILSLAGYTTGSSDFWRFPYLIWRHGGGTFIIAYVISAIVIAIPVYYLEVVVSQFSGRGMLSIWDISPIMKGLGIGMFIINVECIIITPIFRLWIMQYIGYSFMSPLPWTRCDNPWNTPACVDAYRNTSAIITLNVSETVWSTNNLTSIVLKTPVLAEEEFFLHKILQISGSVYDLGTLRWDLCVCLLVFTSVCTACVVKSVESLGKAMYVFTFVPFLLLLIILIRTLVAPGAVAGMKHFLTPDFTKFGNLQLWVQAGFVAASAICTATGGIMEMGSRADFRTNVLSVSVIPCMIDILGSIFTSMVVFSVIGVMAHESGIQIDETLFSGNSAAFVAFSRAFSFFPIPNLWLVMFFFAFLVATSDIVICYFEIMNRCLPSIVPCLDKRPKTTLIIVFVITILTNVPICTQVGGYIYQVVAWYYASWGILVMATLECVIFMWIYGGHMVDENIKMMNGTKMPHIIRLMAAFVCPVFYIVFLVLGIARYKPPVFGTYHYPSSIERIGIVISMLPLIPLVYWMLLSMYRNRRTVFTKEGLNKLFQPSALWGPRDLDVVDEYMAVAEKQKSWSQTAYYNLTGRQRKITRPKTCDQSNVMTAMI